MPSITKSGLTVPCKDWEIRYCGSDQNRWSNMLLDPSDVITGGRKDRQRNLVEKTWLCFQMPHTVCHSAGIVKKLNLTQPRHHKQLRLPGNRKYLHLQQKGASLTSHLQLCCPTRFNDSHCSEWQSSTNEGNYLALVCALSSSQSCLFLTSLVHLASPLSSSSSRPVILQWVFLLSVKGKDMLPSKAQTKYGWLRVVNNKSCCWVWYFAAECVLVCVWGWGGSYSPFNHLLLQLRKKKIRQRQCVCMSVSVCCI